MKTNSREEILNKLRAGKELHRPSSISEPEWDSSVFPEPQDLVTTFINELTQIAGKVTTVVSEADFAEKLKEEASNRNWQSIYTLDSSLKSILDKASIPTESSKENFLSMEVGLTQCEYLVARSGTVVISSAGDSGRRMNVFPPVHIIYATASQLVPFLNDAINKLKAKYNDDYPSLISFITGASRTADIEKTLVMGAHGPKELHIYLNIEA